MSRFHGPNSPNAFNDAFDALDAPERLLEIVRQRLGTTYAVRPFFKHGPTPESRPSAVLLLLGFQGEGVDGEPCIILTKRSQSVPQPGDICCPGGSQSPLTDLLLAGLLSLPISLPGYPIFRATDDGHGPKCRRERFRMVRLLATGLREGVEEMRLNPFGVRFLGPMPAETLSLFRRTIYPMVCGVEQPQRFVPNREVARVVRIPLRRLLNPDAYALLCIEYRDRLKTHAMRGFNNFPCFIHDDAAGRELLWGVTFRIVARFLEMIFGFLPPAAERLPRIEGKLGGAYLTGTPADG